MAIMMPFQCPEVELLGFTTIFGNVATTDAIQNALSLCEIAGRQNLPVAEGSPEPLKPAAEYLNRKSLERNTIAEKLDSLIELTFLHLESCCLRLSEVFDVLVRSFQRTILNNYKSKFTQVLSLSLFSENDEDSSPKFRERSGVLHLFRSSSQSSIPSPSFRSSLVFILTVPNHLSFDDLIPWCGPHLHLHRLLFISFTASFEEDRQQFQCRDIEGQEAPPSKKAATAVTPANDELAKWYGTSRGIKNSQCSFLGATKIVDPKTGEEKQIIVLADDGIRPNSTLMDLAKLKPAFQKDAPPNIAGNHSEKGILSSVMYLLGTRL
ncbi:hypothetical protein HN51_070760 [Arachis hypogaea]